MAGAIELATIKAPVVADQKQFKQGMAEVKKTGKQVANEIEKEFQNSSKKLATSWDNASKKIQKSLKTTEQEAKELTKAAENIYKEGFGKSVNDVVKSLSQTKRALGDIDSAELETATKRAMELRDTMGVKMSKTLKMAKQEMDQYGSTAEQAFDRVEKRLETTEAAWEKLGSKGEKLTTIGSAMTAGLTVPIVGLGVAALKAAGDVETANARIASSLGLTQEQSAVTKQAMEQIFSDGYGETWDDVADSIIQVKQQLGDIPDDQIVKVTENALILRDTLGQDMGESLRGINSLMVNFGMDADSAMDLYVTGVQRGLDKTGELGDNLAEYGQLWSQAGFSAEQMFAVLENGLKSGAYNLDKVNDFVKEFTISLTDGRIADNLDKFSGSTQGIFKEFQKGEKTAQDVFKSVINDLENTTNQQDKLTLASTVWSALGEDNAMKIIESLNDVNDSYDDTADAMEKVKAQQEETFGSRSKALFRDAQTALLPIGEALLDIAERYMPKVEKAVDAFSDTLSSMSDEDIERVLKIGGFIAIAGPTVVAIGKVTKGISTIGQTMKLASGLLGGGAKSFGLLGSAASSAAGSGGIGAALSTGALLNPWVLGMTGTLAIGYGAWKLFGEEAWNSAQRVQEWGTSVSEETGKTLEDVRGFSQDSATFLDNFDKGVDTSAKNVEEKFGSMQKTISDTVDEINKKNQEIIDQLPEEQQEEAKKNADKINKLNEQVEQATQSMSDRVVAIYQKHNGEVSQFTDEEKEIVLSARESMIQAEVNLLNLSGDKKKAVMVAMSADINQMNLKQSGEYAQYLTEAVQKSNESYKNQIAQQKEALEAGLISQSDYAAKVAEIQTNHDVSTQAFADKLYQYYTKMGTDVGTMRLAFEDLGLSYDEVAARANQSAEKTAESNSILAKSTEDMSQEMIVANEQWNAMVFDPKTGEVKTNAKEEIAAAAASEEGWQNLEFTLKNANLNSNARDTVAVAIGEAGNWNELSFDQKFLIANGDQARIEFYDSINAAGKWNDYEAVVKEIGADNMSAIQAILESDETLKAWNELDPELKDIIVNDKASEKIIPGTKLYEDWMRLPDSLKNIKVNSDTSGVTAAEQAIARIPDNVVKNIWIKTQVDDSASKTMYNRGVYGTTAATGNRGLPKDQTVMVNDQKGPLYEELITPPDGAPFIIPKQRDVILPLKKGTRIDKAIDTRSILNSIPRFAGGVGNQLPYDGYNASFKQTDATVSLKQPDGGTNAMIDLLSELLTKENTIVLELDGREAATGLWRYIDAFNTRKIRTAERAQGRRG
ncbi:phage tail tape measure protein [Enterococcus casseliflavus]|uniref:phage tail tape measure protein n=1 Tax=Enterococcus casseliflavus TaxID=37734 RepID=UPI003DA4BDC3